MLRRLATVDGSAERHGPPGAEAVALRAVGLGKRYRQVEALHNVTFDVAPGEVLSVTGPSGAGKSTLGRLVSGLETASEGSLSLGRIDCSRLPPQARRVSHMFESFALYPTRSVAENIASPLTAPTSQGLFDAQQREARIDEVLDLCEMGALRDRLPSQLSGGQKQRVALCRALVQDPSVFVLDEPIGHLDAKLRHKLRGDIKRRQSRLRQGTLWLTPDGIEAMAVGHRMAVLVAGRLQQIGAPDDIFARPNHVSVARLLGDPGMNVVDATLGGGVAPTLAVAGGKPVPIAQRLFDRLAGHAHEARLCLGLRPGALRIALPAEAATPHADDARLPATVYAVEPLGRVTIVTLEIGVARLRVKVAAGVTWPVGAPLTLALTADDVLCFDVVSGALRL